MATNEPTRFTTMPEAELAAAINAPRGAPEDIVAAFKELRRRESPVVAEIARTKINSKRAPTALRTAAAVALGTEITTENQTSLLKALDPDAPVLIKHVAQALGRIGDKAALKKLEAMPTPLASADAKAISFAKSLISYRLRINAHQLNPAAPSKRLAPEQGRSETLTVSTLAPASVDAIATDLRRHLPGVALTNKNALQFKCRNSHHLIVMTKAFEDAEDMSAFGRQSGILAVVLKQTSCADGDYALYEYIFTNAAEKGRIPLVGVRASGETIHSGHVSLDDGGSFSLEAENSLYALPLSLGGKFDKAGKNAALDAIQISPARAEKQQQPREPKPVRIVATQDARANT